MLSISGDQILVDGQPTKLVGLRMSNALMSDATAQELIDHLDAFRSYGVNVVSVYVMGSRFGDVNLVVEDASSTAEVLADLFAELRVALTPEIAEALYTAVVTDTGRFQYSNTTPKALRLASELVEAGADVSKVFVEVYESTPFPKLKLLARALEHARELAGGRIVVSELRRADFEAAGADEPYSEGIIDHLRAVDGAELVALVRELPPGASSARKGSLRSHPHGVDVSAIARSFGGGGHRRAAGFSTDLEMDEITRRIVEAFEAANGDRPA